MNKLIEEKIKSALDKWVKQGRTKEQVYGVQNFMTGAGLGLMNEIYEKGRKENIMAIDTKVSKEFNQELKNENSDLIKLVQEKAYQQGMIKGAKEIADKLAEAYSRAELLPDDFVRLTVVNYIKELEEENGKKETDARA